MDDILKWMVQEGIIGYSKQSGYFYLEGLKENIKPNKLGKVLAEGHSRQAAVEPIREFLEVKTMFTEDAEIKQQSYQCYFDTLGMIKGDTYKFEIKRREGNYTYKYFITNDIMVDYDKVLHNSKDVILVYLTSDGFALFFNISDYDRLEERTLQADTYDSDGSMVTKVRAYYKLCKAIFVYGDFTKIDLDYDSLQL